MKKILTLLPLLSIAAPISANIVTHHKTSNLCPTNAITDQKSGAKTQANQLDWILAITKQSPQELGQHFAILANSYGWDNSFDSLPASQQNWNYNNLNSISLTAKIVNGQEGSDASLFIKYSGQSYNINQWKLTNLPFRNNDQQKWVNHFNSWVNSHPEDIGANILAVAQYWKWDNIITKSSDSHNIIPFNEWVIDRLSTRFSVVWEPRSQINNIVEGVANISGSFNVVAHEDPGFSNFHIDWTINYVNNANFSYEQLRPTSIDWTRTLS